MELLECITVIRYLGIVQIIQPYIRTSVVTLEQSLDIKTLVGSGQSNTELSHRGIAVFVGVCFLIKVTDFTVTIQVFEDNVTRCVVGISLIGCIVELIPALHQTRISFIYIEEVVRHVEHNPPTVQIVTPFLQLIYVIRSVYIDAVFEFANTGLPVQIHFNTAVTQVGHIDIRCRITG